MIRLNDKFGRMIMIFVLFFFVFHECIQENSLVLLSTTDFLFSNFEVTRRKLPAAVSTSYINFERHLVLFFNSH